MSEAETSRLETQLDRIEAKVDIQVSRISRVETDIAVINAKLDPMSRLMWAIITGGVMAFLMSVASMVMVLKGK